MKGKANMNIFNLKNFFIACLCIAVSGANGQHSVLKATDFQHYIDRFNSDDEELYQQAYPNATAWSFLEKNIPLFDCPDKELEKTYYFRWWTFRKHIKNTPSGFVITEFLPDVKWAGKYNTINCPAAHHFYEGRWLHNSSIMEDYARFWFFGGGSLRSYSFWAANSILAFAKTHGMKDLVVDLLPAFVDNYKEWEVSNLCEDGLFRQIDDRDGMEVSVGGSGKRATINSYMYGDAIAIAEIAELGKRDSTKLNFLRKADVLRNNILNHLWDKDAQFFKTLPLSSDELKKIGNPRSYASSFQKHSSDNPGLVEVRELHGYTPWYFEIPRENNSVAWKYLMKKEGFMAPYGLTTTERKSPGFQISYEGGCEWNGPSWPFATSVTLKAMANLLRNYDDVSVSRNDFMELISQYSNSQRRITEKGDTVCWIDENLNPFTGDWITRTTLKARRAKPSERGKDYNHSTFCDIIISDLIGIIPDMTDTLKIKPLIPEDYWNYFCLDNLKYHNKIISIIWDKNGKKYKKGRGFLIFVDGKLRYKSKKIEDVAIDLS